MNTLFIILLMIFLHIVDDYYLQGILASMKQRSWWKENASDRKYEHDYVWALIMHSFSWSFMIMLPIAYVNNFNINYKFAIIFAFNVAIHAFTDNAKANWRLINLWQDQLIHMAQIAFTAILLYV